MVLRLISSLCAFVHLLQGCDHQLVCLTRALPPQFFQSLLLDHGCLFMYYLLHDVCLICLLVGHGLFCPNDFWVMISPSFCMVPSEVHNFNTSLHCEVWQLRQVQIQTRSEFSKQFLRHTQITRSAAEGSCGEGASRSVAPLTLKASSTAISSQTGEIWWGALLSHECQELNGNKLSWRGICCDCFNQGNIDSAIEKGYNWW